MTIGYLYSKFFKKILRGKSILNSKVDKKAKIYSGTQFQDSSLGRYSYVGYDCEIVNCQIGAFCSIANGVIIGGAKHPLTWVSTSPVFYDAKGGTSSHLGSLKEPSRSETIIGNDVWIGSRAIILGGVTIGNGVVIGPGAVVTKDVPDYAIVAGVPAKILRYRFEDEIIQRLCESEWWNLQEESLKKVAVLAESPQKFCDALTAHKTKMGGVKLYNIYSFSYLPNHASIYQKRRIVA